MLENKRGAIIRLPNIEPATAVKTVSAKTNSHRQRTSKEKKHRVRSLRCPRRWWKLQCGKVVKFCALLGQQIPNSHGDKIARKLRNTAAKHQPKSILRENSSGVADCRWQLIAESHHLAGTNHVNQCTHTRTGTAQCIDEDHL